MEHENTHAYQNKIENTNPQRIQWNRVSRKKKEKKTLSDSTSVQLHFRNRKKECDAMEEKMETMQNATRITQHHCESNTKDIDILVWRPISSLAKMHCTTSHMPCHAVPCDAIFSLFFSSFFWTASEKAENRDVKTIPIFPLCS